MFTVYAVTSDIESFGFLYRKILLFKAKDDMKVYDSTLSNFLSQLIKSTLRCRKSKRRTVYTTANNDVDKHFFRDDCNKNEIQFIKLNSEGLQEKSPTRDYEIEMNDVASYKSFLSFCFVFLKTMRNHGDKKAIVWRVKKS